MKSILKILLVVIVVLSGCTKRPYEKQESFYVSCTIDGIPRTYVFVGAGDRTDPGNGIISLYAVLDTATDDDFIGVSVNSVNLAKAVTAGNYTDTTTGFQAYSVFGTLSSQINYNAGSNIVEIAAPAGIDISNHLKVAITELTETTIRGTFSGDFYEEADPSGAIKKVTDGSFYVRMN